LVVSKHLRDKLACIRIRCFLPVVWLDFYNGLTLVGIGLWSQKIKERHNVLTDFERV
jgi:hypothetical protein